MKDGLFPYRIWWYNTKNFWYYTFYSKIPGQTNSLSTAFWGQTFLRWMVVFTIVYCIFPGGEVSVFGAMRDHQKKATADNEILEQEKGMGGMSYFENSPPLELEPVIAGIPEPEEFSKPQLLLYTSYKLQVGDTIGDIAKKFGLNQDTLISVNGITNTRLLQINKILWLPNQNGVLYTVKTGDTLDSIARKYKVNVQSIQTANELFSDAVRANTNLFIPGAQLDSLNLQEINGDLFLWPVRGSITSNYGYRASPFTGAWQFHSGLDIAVPLGTPIKAAMSGRVTTAGYHNSYGNYVVISHHAGYRTLYGHMNVIRTKPGAYVVAGEHIGAAGSSGLSTGPHVHFTIYKDGVTINPRTLIK